MVASEARPGVPSFSRAIQTHEFNSMTILGWRIFLAKFLDVARNPMRGKRGEAVVVAPHHTVAIHQRDSAAVDEAAKDTRVILANGQQEMLLNERV